MGRHPNHRGDSCACQRKGLGEGRPEGPRPQIKSGLWGLSLTAALDGQKGPWAH